MDALAARWPDWHPRLAHYLMQDPLRASRAQLAAILDSLGPPDAQRDLFA